MNAMLEAMMVVARIQVSAPCAQADAGIPAALDSLHGKGAAEAIRVSPATPDL
jgi:hypothetical protein